MTEPSTATSRMQTMMATMITPLLSEVFPSGPDTGSSPRRPPRRPPSSLSSAGQAPKNPDNPAEGEQQGGWGLTQQLDVLLTDPQRVGHPAHGPGAQQLVAHAHRQVAGDVLVLHVLVGLRGAAQGSAPRGWSQPKFSPSPPGSHRPVDAPAHGGPGEGDGFAGEVHHLVLPHVERGADGHDARFPCGEGTKNPFGSPRGETKGLRLAARGSPRGYSLP